MEQVKNEKEQEAKSEDAKVEKDNFVQKNYDNSKRVKETEKKHIRLRNFFKNLKTYLLFPVAVIIRLTQRIALGKEATLKADQAAEQEHLKQQYAESDERYTKTMNQSCEKAISMVEKELKADIEAAQGKKDFVYKELQQMGMHEELWIKDVRVFVADNGNPNCRFGFDITLKDNSKQTLFVTKDDKFFRDIVCPSVVMEEMQRIYKLLKPSAYVGVNERQVGVSEQQMEEQKQISDPVRDMAVHKAEGEKPNEVFVGDDKTNIEFLTPVPAPASSLEIPPEQEPPVLEEVEEQTDIGKKIANLDKALTELEEDIKQESPEAVPDRTDDFTQPENVSYEMTIMSEELMALEQEVESNSEKTEQEIDLISPDKVDLDDIRAITDTREDAMLSTDTKASPEPKAKSLSAINTQDCDWEMIDIAEVTEETNDYLSFSLANLDRKSLINHKVLDYDIGGKAFTVIADSEKEFSVHFANREGGPLDYKISFMNSGAIDISYDESQPSSTSALCLTLLSAAELVSNPYYTRLVEFNAVGEFTKDVLDKVKDEKMQRGLQDDYSEGKNRLYVYGRTAFNLDEGGKNIVVSEFGAEGLTEKARVKIEGRDDQIQRDMLKSFCDMYSEALANKNTLEIRGDTAVFYTEGGARVYGVALEEHSMVVKYYNRETELDDEFVKCQNRNIYAPTIDEDKCVKALGMALSMKTRDKLICRLDNVCASIQTTDNHQTELVMYEIMGEGKEPKSQRIIVDIDSEIPTAISDAISMLKGQIRTEEIDWGTEYDDYSEPNYSQER